MDSKFLKNFFTEKQLSQAELDFVIPKFNRIEFKKNEFLAEAGKIAGDYWFLESGFIRSYAFDTEGNDITTNFYSAGDIVIDWVSFMLRRPSQEYMQATQDCVCWELDFETFQTLFHSIESFREQGRATLKGIILP